MPCSYYRVANTAFIRTTASVIQINQVLKNQELTVKDFKFSGEDQIIILYLSDVWPKKPVLWTWKRENLWFVSWTLLRK